MTPAECAICTWPLDDEQPDDLAIDELCEDCHVRLGDLIASEVTRQLDAYTAAPS